MWVVYWINDRGGMSKDTFYNLDAAEAHISGLSAEACRWRLCNGDGKEVLNHASKREMDALHASRCGEALADQQTKG